MALIDDFGSPTLAFAVSLGQRGIPLHFYGNGAGRWSRYSSRRAPCPPIGEVERFVPWLRQRIRSGEIERLAPTTDMIALYLSMLRGEFAPDVRNTIPPLEELETALIKTRFGAACAQIGQPVPFTAAPDELEAGVATAQRLGFPLMMKPKSHLVVGEQRGRLITSLGELRAHYRPYRVAAGREPLAERYPELCWPLLQQYVPSARTRVFSVSGYKDPRGGMLSVTLSCKRRQWPPDTGISTSQLSWNDPRILERGLETVDQLLSCGIFELELLDDGRELLAIDLNPRAFGFIGLDIALGHDLPWLWYQSTLGLMGQPSPPSPQPIRECRLPIPYMIGRCVNAVLGVRLSGTAGRSPVPSGRVIPMLGDRRDPLPMLLANLALLRHPGGLVRPFVRAALAERRRHQRLAGRT